MSIPIDSCLARETLIVTTSSSVYELIVLGSGEGHVLVGGGSHITEFRRVQFLGSAARRGSVARCTLEIRLRMMFKVGEGLFVTSPIRKFFRPRVIATAKECAAAG